LINITFKKYQLDLKVNWKISRNESLFKENYICEITDGARVGLGECAPNVRYGESTELIESQIELIQKCSSVVELKNLFGTYSFAHSLECATRDALLNFEVDDLYSYLKISPYQSMSTSFSIPILKKEEIADYVKRNHEYDVYKIKITNLKDVDLVKELSLQTNKPIRIDANEGFLSLKEYLEFENEIKDLNIELIEQPMPSSMLDEYIELKKETRFNIMADESIEKDVDFKELVLGFHSVNIKLQKCGGMENAAELAKEAKKHNLKVMFGCMIETSLGISHALNLSSIADYLDLDGSLLLKNDPFNLISLDGGKIKLNN